MRQKIREEAKAEARALGVMSLVCYSTALTAMFVFGYYALALALQTAGRDLAALFTPAGL